MRLFHAHIYFEPQELETARALAEAASRQDIFKETKIFEKPVGPHPRPMIELQFLGSSVVAACQWVEAHRRSLSVLIHEETGNDVRDHSQNIQWLGPPLKLDFDFFELVRRRPDLKVHPE